MKLFSLKYYNYVKKTSKTVEIVQTEDANCIIVVNKQTEEVKRILRMVEHGSQRIVVSADRELVIELFLLLTQNEPGREKPRSVREITRIIELVFDLRVRNAPQQSLGTQSLETMIHNYIREKAEREQDAQ
ncbi:hypothetical protein D0T50_02610 [Bacteroides sp. 214]|uniref:hypothetical protein n=1 Tax=Bacteroides sp. 214 TaxID=2302935 RepID=UPI0013D59038|nr:hypothetical protein [Bacteroides sp. 214]NDW11779.1 hypothetical protein [Bacteroides sp. 214]